MVKKFKFIVLLVFAASVIYGQDLPRTVTNRHTLANWVRTGTFTFTNKTLTTPTLSGLLTHTNTSAATSGTIRSFNLTQTHTGDGAAILEALRVDINSAVQTGQWSNAIVGAINYSGAAGDAGGGLAAAMCSEVTLPAISSPGGSYFAHDFEFNAPTSYVANTSDAFNVAFLRFGVYGSTVASFEDEAYFMHLSTDFTDASGNMWYDNTLRIQIESTDWFIPLSDAEGEYSSAYMIDISNATDASSLTAASIATDGGLAVSKQLFLGDDLDMSVSGTGTYDITLKTNMADALSITDGTDIIVFETTTGTPVVTITPNTFVTGDLAVDGTANLDDVDIDATITADGTVFSFDATTSFNLDNTNASNGISINTATSAGVVSIGHTTSETTVNDNLNVTGDAAVDGTANLDNTDIDGTLNVDGAIDLSSVRTAGADVSNIYKITYNAGDTFTGSTMGHVFKVYDADNSVVHSGGEHCGVYVNMKQLSAMTGGGKSVLYSGHNYSSGGDYQVIDAADWRYGNFVDGYKISGGSIETGIDLSETTVTGKDFQFSNTGTLVASSGVVTFSDQVVSASANVTGNNGATLGSATGAVVTNITSAGNQTTITFTDYAMTITDSEGSGGHGALKLIDFPEGYIRATSAIGDIGITAVSGIAADGAFDMALGSATTLTNAEELGNANVDFAAKVDGTLSSGADDIDIVQTTSQDEDGHAGSTDVWLCVAVADANMTATGSMTFSGTIVITWTNLGDY